MRNVGWLVPLLLASLTAPTFSQQSTPADFKEYCQLMEGRWLGDVTWVTDFPGFGKRGEKVTTYAENKISEDAHVMTSRFFGGTGSATAICLYDIAAKQIRWFGGDSAGGSSQSTVFKKDGQWTEIGTGVLVTGAKTEFTSTLTVSDNGMTHTWTGTATVTGQKTDNQRDVWRRVGK
ncbi:MAG: hypothetical protein ACYC6Y_02085 [Thermoguttaceae bacterium]